SRSRPGRAQDPLDQQHRPFAALLAVAPVAAFSLGALLGGPARLTGAPPTHTASLEPSRRPSMGIGSRLVLIGVGAILAFAVHVSDHGFNVHTVGMILLVVGAVGA